MDQELEKELGSIIAVYPIVNGNGANYVTMNLAYHTKEKYPQAKIAVIDYDFSNPNLGIALTTDRFHNIDNLIDKIEGKFLSEDLFMENMIPLKGGIDLLRGSIMGHYEDYIMPTHLETILDMASNVYDYVFVSCNASHLDDGTSVALMMADKLVVVNRHNQINSNHTRQAADTIENIFGDGKVGVIYNYYTRPVNSDVAVEFSKYEVIGLLPFRPETTDNIDLVKNVMVVTNKVRENNELYERILEKMEV